MDVTIKNVPKAQTPRPLSEFDAKKLYAGKVQLRGGKPFDAVFAVVGRQVTWIEEQFGLGWDPLDINGYMVLEAYPVKSLTVEVERGA